MTDWITELMSASILIFAAVFAATVYPSIVLWIYQL